MMNFPDSPVDGQTYTNSIGLVYTYSAAKGAWTNVAQSAGVLPLSGGTMTGPIVQPAAPAGAQDLVNKAYTDNALAAMPIGHNYLINSLFAIKQRPYTNGAALAAGAYGFDRWGNAVGGTHTVAGDTMTITGDATQVIENPKYIGKMVLSWKGTATASVTGGVATSANGASPLIVNADGSGNIGVKFNAGTVQHPKFEAGDVATAYAPPDAVIEFARCEWYYQRYTQTNSQGFAGFFHTPTIIRVLFTIPEMRQPIAISALSTPGAQVYRLISKSNSYYFDSFSSILASSTSVYGNANVAAAAGIQGGEAGVFLFQSAGAYIELDAEFNI